MTQPKLKRDRIVELARRDESMTSREMAERLGCSRRVVTRALNEVGLKAADEAMGTYGSRGGKLTLAIKKFKK